MRKLLLGAAAAVALAATPAAAEVFVNTDVDVDRDKRVIELIAKIKVVALLVVVHDNPEKFAESRAIFNQENFDNSACENCAEKASFVVDSLSGNEGIVSLNQATGNMNNQGTAVAFSFDVAIDDPDPDGGEIDSGFAEALAAGSQVNIDNSIDTVNILFRAAVIENSGNNNSGLLYVNQAVGNMNNQVNAFSAAVSLAPGVALSESDLGQLNAGNNVIEDDVFKTATITGSLNSNSGIIGVNQASGNMANQANVLSLSVANPSGL